MHNTAAIIPIKGGFIFTPPTSSNHRKNADNKCSSPKEDVSHQGTLQCERGCPCCNKSEEPSVIDFFIESLILALGLTVYILYIHKISGYLYKISDKHPAKK